MIEFEDTKAAIQMQSEISRLESTIYELEQEGQSEESEHLSTVLCGLTEMYLNLKAIHYENTSTNTLRTWEIGNYE